MHQYNFLRIGDGEACCPQAIHSGIRVACVRVVQPANPNVIDLDSWGIVSIKAQGRSLHNETCALIVPFVPRLEF